MKLKVTYELNGISNIAETDEICRVRDGFWINAAGKICYSNKAEIYILPHMIKEIRKEQEEKYQEVVDAEFQKEEDDGRSDHND